MKRRDFLRSLAVAGTAVLGYAAYRHWPETGFSNPCYSKLPPEITEHPLYLKIWDGIDPAQVWDCHVHIIGTGDSGVPDAPWSSPRMDSYWHPSLIYRNVFT